MNEEEVVWVLVFFESFEGRAIRKSRSLFISLDEPINTSIFPLADKGLNWNWVHRHRDISGEETPRELGIDPNRNTTRITNLDYEFHAYCNVTVEMGRIVYKNQVN